MKGWLHVLVVAPPEVETPADLAALDPPADLLELRLDLLGVDAAAVPAWIARAPRPVLATVRSRAEGGAFRGTPAEAARILEAAAAAGAAWIDAEGAVLDALKDLPPTVRVLASVHGTGRVPRAARVTLTKIARPVGDAASLRALAAAPAPGRFFVPFGPLGGLRGTLVGPGRPGLLYGGGAAVVVAGQPTLADLLDVLRAGEVGPEAARYGLVGEPPSRSPSPALHNAIFRAQGRAALYVPLPGLTLDRALDLPFQGFSVTHPYKRAAAAAARSLGLDARTARAVNTLVRTPTGWRGDNTDAAALRDLVPVAPSGATAVVYGAGGLARTGAVVLRELGYGVRLVGRDPRQVARAAAALDCEETGASLQRRPADAVLLNATPAGAVDEAPFLDGVDLGGLLVVDGPYLAAGEVTVVARRARRDGGRLVDGRALLLAQALHQARLFAGARGLPDEPARILEEAIDPRENLVLLGARGAGKTTVGGLVAQRLGRPFIDVDDNVLRTTDRTAAAWIAESGWDAFRAVEAAVLERALARSGTVIATGGGAVEDRRSRAALGRGGTRVLLDVTPETSATRVARDASVPRPAFGPGELLEEARAAIERRAPAWRELAHFTVDANGSVRATADMVARCWGGLVPARG